MIFERYLALPSLSALQEELRTLGIVTRTRRLATGKTIGGVPLTNGPLNHLLRNRMYLGEINHRGNSYQGEHAPIVDAGLFDRVQVKLTEQRHSFSLRRQRSQALLLGILFDDRGNRMTPSFAVKKGVRYRYYVSAVLAQGRKGEAGSISRIASAAIESVVLDSLARLSSPQIVDAPGAARDSAGAQSGGARIEGAIERVVISDKTVEIWRIKNDIVAGGDQPNPLVIP